MRKRGTGGRLTCAAGALDPPAARENDERSLAQNLTRSRLGLGLRRQRERRRGKRIERGGRERGRGSEGVDGGSAASVSTLRRMARVTVGEARRARETVGGSAAEEGMAEWLELRGRGGVGIYTEPMPGRPHLPGRARAVTVGRPAGPSTARTSCRAGTGTPPAVPGRARAVPRRAGPRAARRAGPKWTCIAIGLAGGGVQWKE